MTDLWNSGSNAVNCSQYSFIPSFHLISVFDWILIFFRVLFEYAKFHRRFLIFGGVVTHERLHHYISTVYDKFSEYSEHLKIFSQLLVLPVSYTI